MSEPISSALIICERVIVDSNDQVPSAIRIADVFTVSKSAAADPDQHPVNIHLLFTARFPAEDAAEHQVLIELERPDGETVDVGGSEPTTLGVKIPGATKGLNLSVRLGVYPKLFGTHYFNILLDGARVERAPFTLQLADESAVQEQP